jgi:hypothetical protein
MAMRGSQSIIHRFTVDLCIGSSGPASGTSSEHVPGTRRLTHSIPIPRPRGHGILRTMEGQDLRQATTAGWPAPRGQIVAGLLGQVAQIASFRCGLTDVSLEFA